MQDLTYFFYGIKLKSTNAGVAKLADASDLKSDGVYNSVSVRVRPPAENYL